MLGALLFEQLGDVGPLLPTFDDAPHQGQIFIVGPTLPFLGGVQVVVPALPALLGRPEVALIRA